MMELERVCSQDGFNTTATMQVTHLCICSGQGSPPSSVQASVAWLHLGQEQSRRIGVDELLGLSQVAEAGVRSGPISG